jgi:hypothetical protein
MLDELNERRRAKGEDEFYHLINAFYKEEGNEGHLSPTKRLIDHKNTTFEHKATMHGNI